AHVSDQRGERPPFAAKPALDPRAQGGGQEWTFARGRDGDEQRIAADDRGRDETALRGPVDDVDEDAGRLRLGPAAAVDLEVVTGIDYKPGAGEVACLVVARWDDANIRPSLAQRGDFFDRELTFTQDYAVLAGEVDEHRVIPHAVASSAAASSSTLATSGRVNSGGRSLPSASSLRTAVPLS